MHSLRGATLIDIRKLVEKNTPEKLRSNKSKAGFKDHKRSTNVVTSAGKYLKKHISEKLNSDVLAPIRIIASAISCLVNEKSSR